MGRGRDRKLSTGIEHTEAERAVLRRLPRTSRAEPPAEIGALIRCRSFSIRLDWYEPTQVRIEIADARLERHLINRRHEAVKAFKQKLTDLAPAKPKRGAKAKKT